MRITDDTQKQDADDDDDDDDDSENTKACLFNSNAFDDDDDEEILPFEGVKALCQTLLRRVRRATKGFRNVGKETDVVSNMMMMMMRVASRKRAQAFLWRHFKRPHSSKYLSLGYQKKEEKGDYKNTNDECHHKTPTPTPCCEYRWKSNFSFFLLLRGGANPGKGGVLVQPSGRLVVAFSSRVGGGCPRRSLAGEIHLVKRRSRRRFGRG